jgi:pimeloyl-ACP methyl ester carboxylesterase
VNEQILQIDGCALHVRRAGEGEATLYLHGAHGAGKWGTLFETLSRRAALHVPDHPGFGRSQPRGPVDEIADLAYVYLDYIESQRLKNVHVIGECIGGWTALEMAVRSPGSIGRLTLINSAGIHVDGVQKGDFFIAKTERLPEILFADPARGRTLLAEEQAGVDPAIFHANRVMAARLSWHPRLFDPKLDRWLKRIEAPTALIWGDSNKVFPLAYAQALAQKIPKANVTVLKNCGHLAHLEQPAALAEAIVSSRRSA